ncbi:MAG: hypothetical protein ACKV2Q_26830 [Planctomycetaceae bacterium]
MINREIDRCDVQKVLDFRKSLEESRQVLSQGFANEAEFQAEVDRHLRAFAKGELPKADAPRDKVLLPLAVIAEVQKEKAEKEQALARAEREHQWPRRSAVSSLTYVNFSNEDADDLRDNKREFARPAREFPVSRLTDPTRLAAYKDALSNWNFDGDIQFELTEQAYRWIRHELGNITLKEIGRCMFEIASSVAVFAG